MEISLQAKQEIRAQIFFSTKILKEYTQKKIIYAQFKIKTINSDLDE